MIRILTAVNPMTAWLILIVIVGVLLVMLGLDESYGDTIRAWIAAHPQIAPLTALAGLVRLPSVFAGDEQPATDMQQQLADPAAAATVELPVIAEYAGRHRPVEVSA